MDSDLEIQIKNSIEDDEEIEDADEVNNAEIFLKLKNYILLTKLSEFSMTKLELYLRELFQDSDRIKVEDFCELEKIYCGIVISKHVNDFPKINSKRNEVQYFGLK